MRDRNTLALGTNIRDIFILPAFYYLFLRQYTLASHALLRVPYYSISRCTALMRTMMDRRRSRKIDRNMVEPLIDIIIALCACNVMIHWVLSCHNTCNSIFLLGVAPLTFAWCLRHFSKQEVKPHVTCCAPL